MYAHLDRVHSQREGVEIVHGELGVSARLEPRACRKYLVAHANLVLRVPREFVREERERVRGRLVPCGSEREHLGHEFFIGQPGLRVTRGIRLDWRH